MRLTASNPQNNIMLSLLILIIEGILVMCRSWQCGSGPARPTCTTSCTRMPVRSATRSSRSGGSGTRRLSRSSCAATACNPVWHGVHCNFVLKSLCCVLLHCATLCCNGLCSGMLCCAVPCCAVLACAVCCAVLCCAVLCHAKLCCVLGCAAMRCAAKCCY